MSTFEQKQIERYLPELTKLSHDARLELIARLSESLKESASPENRSIDHLFGAWDSNQSAEEIIESIRAARTPNRDPEPFD